MPTIDLRDAGKLRPPGFPVFVRPSARSGVAAGNPHHERALLSLGHSHSHSHRPGIITITITITWRTGRAALAPAAGRRAAGDWRRPPPLAWCRYVRQAMVITRFRQPGAGPARTGPGLAPLPFESAIPVDLRLRATLQRPAGRRYPRWPADHRPGLRGLAGQSDADSIFSTSCARCATSRTGCPAVLAPSSTRRWAPPALWRLADLVWKKIPRRRGCVSATSVRLRTDRPSVAGGLRGQVGTGREEIFERLTPAQGDPQRRHRRPHARRGAGPSPPGGAPGPSPGRGDPFGGGRDARVIQAEASVKAAEVEAQARVRQRASTARPTPVRRSYTTCCARWTPSAPCVNGDTQRFSGARDAAPFRVLVDGRRRSRQAPASRRRPPSGEARGAAQPWLQAGRLAFLALLA